jgi:hypothetical protein
MDKSPFYSPSPWPSPVKGEGNIGLIPSPSYLRNKESKILNLYKSLSIRNSQSEIRNRDNP